MSKGIIVRSHAIKRYLQRVEPSCKEPYNAIKNIVQNSRELTEDELRQIRSSSQYGFENRGDQYKDDKHVINGDTVYVTVEKEDKIVVITCYDAMYLRVEREREEERELGDLAIDMPNVQDTGEITRKDAAGILKLWKAGCTIKYCDVDIELVPQDYGAAFRARGASGPGSYKVIHYKQWEDVEILLPDGCNEQKLLQEMIDE